MSIERDELMALERAARERAQRFDAMCEHIEEEGTPGERENERQRAEREARERDTRPLPDLPTLDCEPMTNSRANELLTRLADGDTNT